MARELLAGQRGQGPSLGSALSTQERSSEGVPLHLAKCHKALGFCASPDMKLYRQML